MIVKKHNGPEGKLILAICDNEILGKVFEEANRILNLQAAFYKGDELTDEETAGLMLKAYSMNIVGQKSVEFAIAKGYVEKDNIIEVSGIPHAQVVMSDPSDL